MTTNGYHRVGYRPDVDGLRAIAVLLVVASHLDTVCTGGYVGVDVFFVISGYLISATILSEMRSGKFSLGKFYERRVRRILPALLVMMTAASVLVMRYFIPSEVISYARSMQAAIFSFSNLYFWANGGYFDLPSDLKPLLHTWSLAVEEQFYLFFPVFLAGVLRYRPERLKMAVWSVLGLSFTVSCAIVWRNPLAAFFSTPLRAWELLAGTVVSQRWVPMPQGKFSRNAASCAGLLLILIPAFLYDPSTLFPGQAALPAVLGTALVIAAGDSGSSFVGRVLSLRPVVFVGLISYSVYLWHWPLIVFQEAGQMVSRNPVLTRGVKLELLGLSLVIGAISWWAVEQPFRRIPRRIGRGALFWMTGVTTVFLLSFSIWLLQAGGVPSRFPPDALAVAAYVDKGGDPRQRVGECFLTPANSLKDFHAETCLPAADGRPSMLVIGDSHAAAIYPSLTQVYRDRNVMYAAVSGCAPLWPQAPNAQSELCQQMRELLFSDVLVRRRVDTVLLVARWRPADLADLGRTVEYLKLRVAHIAIVGPNIEFDRSEPRLLSLALRAGSVDGVYAHASRSSEEVDRELASLVSTTWHVSYVSFYEDFCSSGCPLFLAASVPLLGDKNHLTPQANLRFVEIMRERGQIP